MYGVTVALISSAYRDAKQTQSAHPAAVTSTAEKLKE